MDLFQYWEFLVYGLIVAPVMAYASGKVTERFAKRDAWKDAQANPYLKKGAKLNQLREAGNPTKVCGKAIVKEVAYGRVTIVQDDDGGIMNFTLQEWKTMHPEWAGK